MDDETLRDIIRGVLLVMVLALGFSVGRCSVGEQFPPHPAPPRSAEEVRMQAIEGCIRQQTNLIDSSRRTPDVLGMILARCRETFAPPPN